MTKLRQLATQRPAAEQGTEVGQARATLRLGYLWPLCRLPSTPTNALTLPLAPLLLNTLPCSAFAPQEVSSPVQISKLDISTHPFRPPRRAWRQDVRRAP